MISRRALLCGVLTLPLAMPISIAAASQPLPWRQALLQHDRTLTLTRPATGETDTFCYWRRANGWDARGYQQACYLLRDVQENRWTQMDPRLLDALFIIQQWLAANGLDRSIHILSGFRTPEHNARLEGAAKNSLHMRGQAVDFTIPGLSVTGLAKMAGIVAGGGVGIYLDDGFVHMDVGPSRTWHG